MHGTLNERPKTAAWYLRRMRTFCGCMHPAFRIEALYTRINRRRDPTCYGPSCCSTICCPPNMVRHVEFLRSSPSTSSSSKTSRPPSRSTATSSTTRLTERPRVHDAPSAVSGKRAKACSTHNHVDTLAFDLYHFVYTGVATGGSFMSSKKTRLFMSGNSQAVRIPR